MMALRSPQARQFFEQLANGAAGGATRSALSCFVVSVLQANGVRVWTSLDLAFETCTIPWKLF